MKGRVARASVGICLGFSLLAGSLLTGCIGGMAVSGEVRKFNLNVVQGKWAREGVFLVLYIIPVYPIAGFIDLVVVNSIEFHTGTNPVSGKPRIARVGETRRVETPEGVVSVSTLREDGSIDFEISEPGGETHFVNLSEADGRVIARDAQGGEIASVERGADLNPAIVAPR